jgi:hypothetical protein
MSGRAGMIRALRFGMLFGTVDGLVVCLPLAPTRAANLDVPTNEKILEVLKAKRLTRCPQASTRSRCGGAQLQTSPPEKAEYQCRNHF